MTKLNIILLLFAGFASTVLSGENIKSQNRSNDIVSDPNGSSKVLVYVLEIDSAIEGDFSERPKSKKRYDPVVVLINDNPVSFYSWGIQINQINQYLKPGKNTITIKGKREHEIWIEIKTFEKGRDQTSGYQKISDKILEKVIYPNKKSVEWNAVFKADISYNLPIFRNQTERLEKKLPKKQILKFLNNIHRILQKNDISEHKKLSLEGRGLWSQIAYGVSKEKFNALIDLEIQHLKEYKFLPYDEGNIKFIYGKDIVLVYTGFDGPLIKPYLWKIFYNKQKISLEPLRITRINNKLIVW